MGRLMAAGGDQSWHMLAEVLSAQRTLKSMQEAHLAGGRLGVEERLRNGPVVFTQPSPAASDTKVAS